MAEETVAGASEKNVNLGDLTTKFNTLINKENRSGDDNKQLLEITKILKEYGKFNKTIGKDLKEQKRYRKEIQKAQKQQVKDNDEMHKTVKDTIGGLLRSGFKAITSGIDQSIKTYSQYAIKVNTELRGTTKETTKAYTDAVEKLNNAIGSTGLAKMSDVLSQMSSLTAKGIVANVEQKAFLASIKDGIISTFDIADSTMLRIIKLQGEESTTNRMVMQASLRDYLNQQYQNSQYIVENYKQVSDSLLEATSLLTSSMSLGLESTVQKWMGSLASVGLSTNAINSLAQAIGYLGSGDLQGMSSSGVQKLVMMGANRAGLSYSDMLIGGVSAENAEALMAGMVAYLGGLSGNNVILSEYAKIFGVSVSDIVAARNATKELESIRGSTIAYTESALSQYLTDYSNTLQEVPSVLYDALMDNMFFGMGTNVASSRFGYASYKVGGLLSSIGNDISKSGEAIVSTVGTVMNVAGVAAQLLAAFGVTSGKGIKGVMKTITGLGDSFMNLFAAPDSLEAFNKLGIEGKGFNIIGSQIEGADAFFNTRNPNTSPYTATSGGNYGDQDTGEGTKIDIDESAIEEAEQAKTANDIYEFLSDDVVTITPYISEEMNFIAPILEFQKAQFETTKAIAEDFNKLLTGEYALVMKNEGYDSGMF